MKYVHFVLESNVTKLSNEVHAKILGIHVPFWGVHGSDACDKLFLEDAETKTTCPLSAGNEYVYKDTFRISEHYPKVIYISNDVFSYMHFVLTLCSNFKCIKYTSHTLTQAQILVTVKKLRLWKYLYLQIFGIITKYFNIFNTST